MASIPLDNRHRPIIEALLRALYRGTECTVKYKNEKGEERDHTIIPYKFEDGPDPRIYAYDERDRQTKEFLMRRFTKFIGDGDKKTPPYTPDKNSFKKEFDPSGKYEELVMQDDMDIQMSGLEKRAGIDARRVLRIANRIMEFSGAEANIFVPDKRSDSYDEVGDDGRG